MLDFSMIVVIEIGFNKVKYKHPKLRKESRKEEYKNAILDRSIDLLYISCIRARG